MRDKANRIEYEWSTRACRYIRHPADRKEVMAELDAHMADRIAELTDSGMRYHEALRRTEAAMGDPDEVGRMLRNIHTPWMSLLLTASKWICAALILFSLIFYGQQVWWELEARLIYGVDPWSDAEIFRQYCLNYEGEDMTVCGIRPVRDAHVDDYTFRVVKGSYLRTGTLILWIECDHPFYKADPEGFMRQVDFYGPDGTSLMPLLGNRHIDGNTAIYEVFNESIEIVPITLVADYGGKGFTLAIEPEVIP